MTKQMKPEHLTQARETLQVTQKGMGELLDKSERYVLYRESGVQSICSMMRDAICWKLLPEHIRKKYLPKFLR